MKLPQLIPRWSVDPGCDGRHQPRPPARPVVRQLVGEGPLGQLGGVVSQPRGQRGVKLVQRPCSIKRYYLRLSFCV